MGSSRKPRRPLKGRAADAVIVELARRQHGVVKRAQLLAAGLTPRAVEWRVERGRLVPLYVGVYRVGVVAAPREREMAALLASGAAAMLSHGTAGLLLGLPLPPEGTQGVHVTAHARRSRQQGIVHHRSTVSASEVTRIGPLRLTTAARTLLDLAGSTIAAHDLERAVAHALRERLTTVGRLRALLARHPRRSGARRLRALIGAAAGPALTRSEAEALFLAVIRRAQLAAPRVNARVERHEVDFLWPDARLIVEVDGYAFHAARQAFETDRRRDAALTIAGYRVLRVSWRQLNEEPEAVLARVAQSLVLGRQQAV